MDRLAVRGRTSLTRALCASLIGVGALVPTIGCNNPPPPPQSQAPPAPAVKTGEERVKWYQDCWQQFNDKAWDTFLNCYSENAMSEAIDSTPSMFHGRAAIIENDKANTAAFSDRRGELKLVLGNGAHLVSVALWTATNDGAMPTPDGQSMPATGKKIGLLMAHSAELDATGSRVDMDASYIDEGTIMGQLGVSKAPVRKPMAATGAPPVVVVAKNDETETRNIAAFRSVYDALSKHDTKTVEGMMADNYMMIDMTMPADQNKKQSIAGMAEYFKAFPDMVMSVPVVWAAGDYVVGVGTFSGTNTGDMPSMGLKKTGKKMSLRFLEVVKIENGKATDDWMFYNGAAFAAQLGLK